MPMEYEIDREANLVRITGKGRVTDAEMVQCVSDLRNDPELKPDMHALSDMRAIEVGFTSEGVAGMLAVMDRTADRRSAARAAIVVSSEVAFGMGRMLELRSENRADPTFQVFRDMDSALEWLGIG